MYRTSIALVSVVMISVLALALTSCQEDGDESSGTVTVTVIDAAAANGHCFYAYVYEEGEADVNNPATVLATNVAAIATGTATMVLKVDDGNFDPTGETWTGDGGAYDIYVYTDDGCNNEPGVAGDDRKSTPFPEVITIDGDITVEKDYGDFVAY